MQKVKEVEQMACARGTVLTLVVLIAQAKSGSILYIWMREGLPKGFGVIQPFFHWINLVFLTFWVMRTTFEVRS